MGAMYFSKHFPSCRAQLMNSPRKNAVFETARQTRRDGLITLLARSDPASAQRLGKVHLKAGRDLLNARAGENILEIGFATGHSLAARAKGVGPKGKMLPRQDSGAAPSHTHQGRGGRFAP